MSQHELEHEHANLAFNLQPPLDPSLINQVFRTERRNRGILITIDGFDGSGKSTQVAGLSRCFLDQGRKVVITRQPTDWYRNDPLVRAFHDKGGSPEEARVLALFAAADRLRHIAEVVDPALKRGDVIICDRYVLATFAVFSHRGVDLNFLVRINQGVPRPDYAFYLDVPTDVLLARLSARDGNNLKHEEKSIERVESIKSRWHQMRGSVLFVDGTTGPDLVTRSMFAMVGTVTPATLR